MYKVTINAKNTFEVEKHKENYVLNNNSFELDVLPLSNGRLHVLKDNKSYSIDLVSFDKEKKEMEISINGAIISVSVKDQYDELLYKLGIDSLISSKIADIKAPMPGLVLQIMVKEADLIKKGDTLLVLEAMKMENSIKASGDGIIKSIKINKGDKVEKNQVLILIE